MFSWFKKERPATELAAPLAALVIGATPEGLDLDGVDQEAFRRYSACALIFAVDFAMYDVFKDTPRKHQVADAFWEILVKEPIEGISVASEARELLPTFGMAIQNAGPMGFSYEVGKVVAEKSGRPGDAAVIVLSAKMFISALGEAKRLLVA